MIRKYWESWILWVVMDIVAIGIYFAKGLFVVSGLDFLFLVIATIGLVKWYRDWNPRKTTCEETDTDFTILYDAYYGEDAE